MSSRNVKESETDTLEDLSTNSVTKFPVLILRKKLRASSDDRYIVDIALAAQFAGHHVTIYTTEFDDLNCLEEVHPKHGCLEVKRTAYWIPRSFPILRSIVMAIKLILFPPKPTPKVIIIDDDIIPAFVLSKLSKYKLIFVNHFRELKQIDLFTKFIKLTPDLWTARMMHSPHEIVVQSEDMAKIFRRSFPRINQEIQILNPCVDTGAWNQDTIEAQRIIPDLPINSFMFFCCGPYLPRSNFKLALEAFDQLLAITEVEIRRHLHLVIGGNYKDTDVAQQHYHMELVQMAREKNCGGQVTFLKQLPTIHKKTLIQESIAVIHTTKYDIYGDTILAAMSLKRPIIGTETGFVKGVLTHRISSILVDGNSIKFAAAMHKILTNPTIQAFVSDMAKDVFDKDYTNIVFNSKVQTMLERIGEDEVEAKKID